MDSQRTLLQRSPRDEPLEDRPTRRVTRASPAGVPERRTLPVPARRPAPSELRASSSDLVLGRYRLLERLGSGGFGVVWRAHDDLLGREVAVKRIWLGPDGDRERATREAQASARLSHPAIVALYEACVVEEAFYLISELVKGATLARLISEGELEDREVLEIGLALTGALSHAHARGVIHRDIKPQNVLVPDRVPRGGEAAKLTDFGGASLVGEEALTRTGDVLGTLAYMAPEQSEGAEVGEQADLYALALVLYESLCGVNPVRGPTPAATARRIGGTLESLARRRRELPRALTGALDGALAPAPEDRGSLEHLRLALEDTLEDGLGTRPRRRSLRSPARLPEPTREAQGFGRRVFAPERIAAPHGPPEPDDPVLHEEALRAPMAGESPQRLTLPRALWIAAALAVILWQAWVGRPGVALLAVAALLPLVVAPSEPRSSRVGGGWLVCSLAPLLGVVGLAGAFPAVAGQGGRWRERVMYGALGYWWLALAGPLLGRRLWLGAPSATPARAVWEGSLGSAAGHVIVPMLSLGVLLVALLWGSAAAALPWLVRGRSAVLDVLAAVAWSLALVLATPVLAAGLDARAALPSPRGLLLGAVLGAIVAIAARALRGPV